MKVTAAKDATSTNGLRIGGRKISAIILPANFTAANISFEVSLNGTSWLPLTKPDGSALTIAGTASKVVPVGLATLLPFVRLAFSAAQTAAGGTEFELITGV